MLGRSRARGARRRHTSRALRPRGGPRGCGRDCRLGRSLVRPQTEWRALVLGHSRPLRSRLPVRPRDEARAVDTAGALPGHRRSAHPTAPGGYAARGASDWSCKWTDWLRVPNVGSPVTSMTGALLSENGQTWDWAPSASAAPPAPHYFAMAGLRMKLLSKDGYCGITDKGAVVCGHCGVCGPREAKEILTTVATPHGAKTVSPLIHGGVYNGVCVTTPTGTLAPSYAGATTPQARSATDPFAYTASLSPCHRCHPPAPSRSLATMPVRSRGRDRSTAGEARGAARSERVYPSFARRRCSSHRCQSRHEAGNAPVCVIAGRTARSTEGRRHPRHPHADPRPGRHRHRPIRAKELR